ncbi:MAG TPA: exonuclease domain-containing protein [Bacteroidia bacterium]|nr:exonuclease domain-containing protein [Bacteroidia bacterium]HNT81136.1 exonuclease domain-containing protein [Bacteroidia bacterium]
MEPIQFAIVDVETTGGNGYTDKIIEIAILISDGRSIVDRYHTLINPLRPVPPFIENLTGIKNNMLQDAPVFDEVAYDILRVLQNKIFIAHNVHFDLTFIREEFKQLKLKYSPQKLCTVQMGRKAFPGFQSYSLNNFTRNLGISLNGHHRAEADAIATAEIFHKINSAFPEIVEQQLNEHEPVIKRPVLFDPIVLDEMPETSGVYFFKDIKEEIIYIGKSINLRNRVRSYFIKHKLFSKYEKIAKETAHIDYIETGNELMALLIEDEEIKKHQPLYNQAQKKSKFPFGLFSDYDRDGYLNLQIRKTAADEIPHTQFQNRSEYASILGKQIKRHSLCPALCGIESGLRPCFEYKLHLCNGACVANESSEQYNKRVQEALKEFSYAIPDFVIVEKGRHAQENAIVLVRSGKYCGRGYIDRNISIQNGEEFLEHIEYKEESLYCQRILRQYLRKTNNKKIITL